LLGNAKGWHHKILGAPAIVLRVATVAFAASSLVSCGIVQRAYWDAKVEEMCRSDGGVTVYERVKVSPEDYKRLVGAGGNIVVSAKSTAKPDAAYIAERKHTEVNENPAVYRSETSFVRTSDGKVLSRLVHYARVGGELFRPYGCREVGIQMDIERQTFEVSPE
jgi:hypothetical protein